MSSMFAAKAGSLRTALLHPAVVVHDLAQANAALAAGLALTMLSAPGAGCFAGAGWWRALVAQARATHPDTPCQDVLDCADAPGHAMAAIRLGQAIGDHGDRDRIRNQKTTVHVPFGLNAERRLLFNVFSENVTGRNMRDLETTGKIDSHSPFTGSWWSQHDQMH